eukprot:12364107-Alexandrium_andersonii.AAC.1
MRALGCGPVPLRGTICWVGRWTFWCGSPRPRGLTLRAPYAPYRPHPAGAGSSVPHWRLFWGLCLSPASHRCSP